MRSFAPPGAPPVDPGPVTIEIPGKTAMLMVKLAQDVGAKTPGDVVLQALGLLQMLRAAAEGGKRVILRDPKTGAETDLAL